jgi:hypothetical protein
MLFEITERYISTEGGKPLDSSEGIFRVHHSSGEIGFRSIRTERPTSNSLRFRCQ